MHEINKPPKLTPMSQGYVPDLPALTDEERQVIEQGGAPNRLRQVLAHQHPVHEAMGKAFDNMGGVTGLTHWAEDNKTDFYKLFAKTAPQPKEATFVQINTQINGEDSALDATQVKDVNDPNHATAVYQIIMNGK